MSVWMAEAVKITRDDLVLAIWQHIHIKPYFYCTLVQAIQKCAYGMHTAFKVDRKCQCAQWAYANRYRYVPS